MKRSVVVVRGGGGSGHAGGEAAAVIESYLYNLSNLPVVAAAGSCALRRTDDGAQKLVSLAWRPLCTVLVCVCVCIGQEEEEATERGTLGLLDGHTHLPTIFRVVRQHEEEEDPGRAERAPRNARAPK